MQQPRKLLRKRVLHLELLNQKPTAPLTKLYHPNPVKEDLQPKSRLYLSLLLVSRPAQF